MIKYRFTPTLLDKYQKLIDSDNLFESDYNIDSETGDFKMSSEECHAKAEQDLLDAINRVPYESTRPQLLGTLLNEAVDCMLLGRPSDEYPGIVTLRDNNDTPIIIRCMAEGQSFNFRVDDVRKLVRELSGAIPQDRQLPKSATIQIAPGEEIELYGYPDYIYRDRVIDLKTTSRYRYYKYSGYWQRFVYPYIMMASGEIEEVSRFEFLVALVTPQKSDELGEIISLSIGKECYDVSLENDIARLITMCRQFSAWCDANSAKINKNKTHIYPTQK